MPRKSGEQWVYDPADLSFDANLTDGDVAWYNSTTGKIVNQPLATSEPLVAADRSSLIFDAVGSPILGLRPSNPIALAGDSSVIIPASTAFLRMATLTLLDSDILNILGTPKSLVIPPTGTAILPVAGWAIHDFRNGVYLDAIDQIGDISIEEAISGAEWATQIPISDAEMPSPPGPMGAVKFFTFLHTVGTGASTVSWNNNGIFSHAGPAVYPSGGALRVVKDRSSTVEFTGGGTGNTLKIFLYYLTVPTS